MAIGVFDPTKTCTCRLWFDFLNGQPLLPGKMEADTVETVDPVFGREEWAIFTVDEAAQPGMFRPQWVGTYRLPMGIKSSWFGGYVE